MADSPNTLSILKNQLLTRIAYRIGENANAQRNGVKEMGSKEMGSGLES
jgi:hypothetical protein